LFERLVVAEETSCHPHISGCDRSDSERGRRSRPLGRRWDHAPLLSVPMKNERVVLAVKSFLETACPYIFARDSGYAPQFDDLRVRRRGAGYHGPLIAI